MTIDQFDSLNLPDVPGVYRFMGEDGNILYIGKATSLRDRVRSYFNDDVIATRGRRIVDMVAISKNIEYDVTPSVLEALILEANEIKKYLPKYNSQQKDNKSYNFIVITNEDYPKIITERARTLDFKYSKKEVLYSFGPFTSGNTLREMLKIIRKIFPYRDDKCIPHNEQKSEFKKPCFARQIGLCPGVCTGEISLIEYKKNIKNIALFLSGKRNQLVKSLEKEMHTAARLKRFEYAQIIKKQIYSLDHVNDVALIKEGDVDFRPGVTVDLGSSPETRIEAYDIAHTGGKEQVGVMVVVEDGVVEKSWYRKFKIKKVRGANDIAALREILKRRLRHDEWPMPQIIVMDGGEPQRKAAQEIINSETFPKDTNRPIVVSVVKDKSHKPKDILGDESKESLGVIEINKKGILAANSEAHRFAIAYHRSWRNKLFR